MCATTIHRINIQIIIPTLETAVCPWCKQQISIVSRREYPNTLRWPSYRAQSYDYFMYITFDVMHTVYQIKYVIYSVNMSWLHLGRLNNDDGFRILHV